MKIAIVSDTHDNLPNFKKIIDWLNKPITTILPSGKLCESKEKVKVILHCGDICSQETINEAVRSFNGEIKFVRGNGDFKLNNIPEKMEIQLGGKKIGFVHYPKIAKEMAESGKYDIVFYGHTHKPWEEKVLVPAGRGYCRLVNPGEVAGQRFKPTFAIYDTKTDKLELKILEKI